MKEDLAEVVSHGDGDGVCDASSCDGDGDRGDDHRHHDGACDGDDAPDRTKDLHNAHALLLMSGSMRWVAAIITMFTTVWIVMTTFVEYKTPAWCPLPASTCRREFVCQEPVNDPVSQICSNSGSSPWLPCFG